jgi:hypothetical protein
MYIEGGLAPTVGGFSDATPRRLAGPVLLVTVCTGDHVRHVQVDRERIEIDDRDEQVEAGGQARTQVDIGA